MNPIHGLVPIFETADVNETTAFYRDTLRFEGTAAYPDYDPVFCSLMRGGAVVVFTLAGGNGVNSLYICPADADALWEEIMNAANRGVFAVHGRIRVREFGICDPTGCLLRFGHDLQ